jgi:putative addiction module CopG family antidote
MTVTLPAAFESFVSQKVASGCYASAEEVVADSLDLLKHQEHWQRTASAKIEEGLRDLDAGRTLTEAESRRETEAFKSRWRAGKGSVVFRSGCVALDQFHTQRRFRCNDLEFP